MHDPLRDSDRHDPLDALRDAWARVDAPEVPGGDRLADEDATTRGAVGWARGAWASVPIPALDEDAAATDATTKATVEWTRGAWATVPVPETPALETATSGEGKVLAGRFGQVGVWRAAAAAFLVSLTSWITLSLVDEGGERPLDVPNPTLVSRVALSPIAPFVFEDGLTERVAAPSLDAEDLSVRPDPLVALMGSDACVCAPQTPLGAPAGLVPAVHRNMLLDSVIQANRKGSWSDAAKRAQLVLEGEGAVPEVRLAALCQLALSFQALGQHDQSTAYLDRLEAELSDLRAR